MTELINNFALVYGLLNNTNLSSKEKRDILWKLFESK